MDSTASPGTEGSGFRLRLLGDIDLRGPDGARLEDLIARAKPMALLAYLAVEGRESSVRRDELIGLFWADSTASNARNSLRQSLHVLRSSLGSETIPNRGQDEVGVESGLLRCDASLFQERLEAEDWRAALELYEGDFMPGFHLSGEGRFVRWMERKRRTLRREATDAAIEHSRESDDPERWARRALELSRYDEEVGRNLMRLLAERGNVGAALSEYRLLRSHMRDEYGTEPSPETRELARDIRDRPLTWKPGDTGDERPQEAADSAPGTADRDADSGPEAHGDSGPAPGAASREPGEASPERDGAGEPDRMPLRLGLAGLLIALIVAITIWGQLGFSLFTGGAAGPDSLTIGAATADSDGDFVPDRLGDSVTVSGVATVGSGTLNEGTFTVFLQDSTGGIQFRSTEAGVPIDPGDLVVATGTLGHYNGLTQVTADDYRAYRVDSTASPEVPAPVELTALDSGTLERHEGELVRVSGRVLARGSNEGGEYIEVTGSDGGQRVSVFAADWRAVPLELDGYDRGDRVTVTGILGQYDWEAPFTSQYQIYPRSPEDIRRIGEGSRPE